MTSHKFAARYLKRRLRMRISEVAHHSLLGNLLGGGVRFDIQNHVSIVGALMESNVLAAQVIGEPSIRAVRLVRPPRCRR